LSTFIWQSSDGNWDNPESWGISSVVSGSDAATTATDATVDLTGDAPDLSGVAAGDTLYLVDRTDGKNSGEYFEITAVDDVADTVEVTPTPSATDSGITWVISEALPGANSANDVVIFPANSNQSLVAGLDQSTQGKFTSITVHGMFGGAIAFEGSPLIASATSVLYEGAAGFHYKDGGSETDVLIVNARSMVLNTLRGKSGGAKIVELRVVGGWVKALELATYTVYVSEGNTPNQATIVEWDSSCSSLGLLYMNRGHFTSEIGGSAVLLAGGVFLAAATSTGSIGYIVMTGGYLIHNSDKTVSAVVVLGGLLDFSQDERSKTISILRVWPGAVAIIPDWVTVTSGGALFDELVLGG